MKAWGRLIVAAGAALVMLAIPAGTSAAPRAHRRHVQVFPPRNEATMNLGEHGGYELDAIFKEPDEAILEVSRFERETETATVTNYGAHFRGSLPFGRLRADFGAVGSISVRFRPGGDVRTGKAHSRCSGRSGRTEGGSFVGRIELDGEGGYFHVAASHARGSLDRSFRLRCQVRHHRPTYPPQSLREMVTPEGVFEITSGGDGNLAKLEVGRSEGSHWVGMRVDQFGTRPGADLALGEFEYQGKMPVGRAAGILRAPPGTFITSLPGEHPATATLKPPVPFSGEAEYVATSPTSHSWTGDLAVQLPGQLLALAGPEYASSLCVARVIRSPHGCSFVLPDWQWNEE